MDAFFERGLNYWDYAAGGLIAREAGAMVGGLGGQPESTSMAVVAGPELYRQLDTFLSRLNPERDAPRSQEQDALPGRGRGVLADPNGTCQELSACYVCAGRERDRIPRRNRAQLRP
jgi:hypothetical protein